MVTTRRSIAGMFGTLVCFLAIVSGKARADVVVSPASVTLEGNFAQAQLLVTDSGPATKVDERSTDVTHKSGFTSSNPQVVTVSSTGRLLAKGNGDATVAVSINGVSKNVPVKVTGFSAEPKISFITDIMPILSKAGCNAGACHASQYGKGGFKLSVFGFAPDEDYRAIIRDSMGRRTNPLNPENSLLLVKPTLNVPHEGGRRIEPGSVDHQIMQRWLATGALAPTADAAKVVSMEVLPKRRVGAKGFTQQLQVVASYANGKKRDVTAWCKFDSMDDAVVQARADGLVIAVGKGQGTLMVRFDGRAEIMSVVVPYADAVQLTGWTENNFIDRLAAAKFKEIGIEPSGLCDDATFLRRVFLDVIGTLPTVEEARKFLDSKAPDKRRKLIDQLLGLTGDPNLDIYNNAYAAYWSLKWSDLIRSNSGRLGEQGMWAMHNWLTGCFRDNKPFDQLVRELINAKGSTFSNGPANYYRLASNPQELTEATSQLFLGVRLACAKCHHHPYENLSQADYYSFAAFFARVGTKTSQEFGLFGQENVIVVRSDGEVSHPKSGKVMTPTPLGGQTTPETPDRRQALSTWLTGKENPYFARNVVNRYFGYLFGHGLVEPIDDMRATNPPSNVALMDTLAAEFTKSGYNVKQLLRTILSSRLYQLDSQPTPDNVTDSRFYSHYNVKRLPAEALLDALDQVSGVLTKFEKLPLGTRAIELPDAKYNSYLLTTFGKPRREAVCECERVSEPNLAQALHLLNSDVLAAKLSNSNGRLAKLIAAKKSQAEIVDELFLATLCRRPTADEKAFVQKQLAESGDAKIVYEDLLWSLLNSKQFLFVR